MTWRGLVAQTTNADVARQALCKPIRVYIGFDPSASSLHVGSLLPIVTLLRLQQYGHTPIALVGGGTGMIGDPSGKSAERRLLTDEEVRSHAVSLQGQLQRFFAHDMPNPAIFADNLDWLGGLSLIAFLRDIGKHFSVGAMIHRDSVRNRLEQREQGISYTEFSYMLLQAFDFLELYRRHGCQAQFGGSDQWGNIVSGIDLIDRLCPHAPDMAPFGLTMPLIVNKSGQKFGKTESGTIWLDANLTSPYRFYQFWVNVDDDDALRYLRFFTFLTRAEIEAIESAHAAAPHLRAAQKALGQAMTTLVHGTQQTEAALAATAILFGADPACAPMNAFEVLAGEIPTRTLQPGDECSLKSLLVGDEDGHPFKSGGEAKRALAASSVSIGGIKLGADLAAALPDAALCHGRYALIRVGKKQFYLADCGRG